MNLMSAHEVAVMLGQSHRSIHKAANRGDLPVHIVGKTYVFELEEVLEAVESGQHVVRGPGRPKKVTA